MGWMFLGCKNLTSLDLSGFDTSRVIDMSDMFSGCEGLATLDLSSFDMSKAKDISDMFVNCKGLKEIKMQQTIGQNTNTHNMFLNCPVKTIWTDGKKY